MAMGPDRVHNLSQLSQQGDGPYCQAGCCPPKPSRISKAWVAEGVDAPGYARAGCIRALLIEHRGEKLIKT